MTEEQQQPIEKYNQNQTQFAVEEPLFEQPVAPPPQPQPVQPIEPKRKVPRWAWVVVGVLGVILLIAVVVALLRPEIADELAEENSSAGQEVQLTPLQQRLKDARELLKAANPTAQELPLPSINYELKIDD